jgi:glutaredoxin 3
MAGSGIMDLVAGNPVAIFTKSSCCMSHTVESLIRSFGANPTIYELDQVPNGRQIERALLQLPGCQ